MPNPFDPYRDALVVETLTVWPKDLPGAPLADSERRHVEERLHADPAQATQLEYVKIPAGFIRKITVAASDLQRVAP
ncbi:MAG: hypothetical protein ABFC77_07565 [Thermoguttaceae bacterium]